MPAIDLTKWAESVNVALEEGTPCLLISADKEGHPDVAFKGSMMVLDGDHLAWWERSRAEQILQVEENQHVAVLYRNTQRSLLLRFYGDATIYKDGPIRQQIMDRTIQAELDKDPERLGFGVALRVDRVRLQGKTFMEREA